MAKYSTADTLNLKGIEVRGRIEMKDAVVLRWHCTCTHLVLRRGGLRMAKSVGKVLSDVPCVISFISFFFFV